MLNPISTDASIDKLAKAAVINAEKLITEAKPNQKMYDKANRKRFTRLFKDPDAIAVTVTLTDEVMRIKSPKLSLIHI